MIHVAAAFLLLAPTALLFIVLPRGRPRRLPVHMQPMRATAAIVGFSDTVEIGAIGAVLDNLTRVMDVEISVDGQKAGLDYVPVMRGASFDHYDGRHWESTGIAVRGAPRSMYADDFPKHLKEESGRRVSCRVLLEPINSRKLFAPFAVAKVRLPANKRLRVNRRADSIELTRMPTQRFSYTAESIVVPPEERDHKIAIREYWSIPGRFRPDYVFLDLPRNFSPRVVGLAREIAPPEEYGSPIDIARRIESYLRENYAYTLDVKPTPGIRDPIEDFLLYSKRGYCEHYATAMVLLLRARGVPARLVAGFKGGTYNDIGGYFVFRQSDAHTWVEAYVMPYGWVTFDPTGPSQSQRDPMRQPFGGIGDFFDFLRNSWIRYVVAYDHVEQSRVYAAARSAWKRVTAFLRGLILESRPGSEPGSIEVGISPAGAAAALTVFACLAGLVLLLFRRGRRRRRKGAAAAFYRRMERFFRRRGLPRAPSVTPNEFAAAVEKNFPACAEIAQRLTGRFCEMRYGGRPLEPDEEKKLMAAARRLRESVSTSP